MLFFIHYNCWSWINAEGKRKKFSMVFFLSFSVEEKWNLHHLWGENAAAMTELLNLGEKGQPAYANGQGSFQYIFWSVLLENNCHGFLVAPNLILATKQAMRKVTELLTKSLSMAFYYWKNKFLATISLDSPVQSRSQTFFGANDRICFLFSIHVRVPVKIKFSSPIFHSVHEQKQKVPFTKIENLLLPKFKLEDFQKQMQDRNFIKARNLLKRQALMQFTQWKWSRSVVTLEY